MNYKEKLKFYAGARRADAVKLHRVVDGNFVPYWVGTLRGKLVTIDSTIKHHDRESAVNDARAFRESCRQELEQQQ